MRCPFCNSSEVEKIAAWGGQLMTSQMHCQTCNSHFEAVRDDFARLDEPEEDTAARAK